VVSIETVAPLHDSVLAERARSAVEILLQETPGLNLWPPVTLGTLTLLISLQDLRLRAGARVPEAKHVLAQLKQRLVEVWADFEQTIVNK